MFIRQWKIIQKNAVCEIFLTIWKGYLTPYACHGLLKSIEVILQTDSSIGCLFVCLFEFFANRSITHSNTNPHSHRQVQGCMCAYLTWDMCQKEKNTVTLQNQTSVRQSILDIKIKRFEPNILLLDSTLQ